MSALDVNAHFARIQRAPCEIGHLHKKLPVNFSAYEPLAPDDRLIAEAAHQHAGNANDSLMRGLEVLGEVVSMAGRNQDGEISQVSLMQLSELVVRSRCSAHWRPARLLRLGRQS